MTATSGQEVRQQSFTYSDILANLMSVLFTGGDCAENLADWCPFDGQTSDRLIVSRIKRDDQQGDLFSESAYTYRAILTNDSTSSPETIVAFYNKRGASERVFDAMGNDLSWSLLPCSFLSENTTFIPNSCRDGNHGQFLPLHHRGILQAHPLAESHLPAQKVYLSLH